MTFILLKQVLIMLILAGCGFVLFRTKKLSLEGNKCLGNILIFFFTGLPMPELLAKSISHLAGVNTPLAMFTIGVYMAQMDVSDLVKRTSIYLVALLRLIVIPLIALALLTLIPAGYYEMKMALLIAIACPVGSNVAVYAQLHNCDYAYSVETVIISTFLAVVTMPLIVQLATIIW